MDFIHVCFWIYVIINIDDKDKLGFKYFNFFETGKGRIQIFEMRFLRYIDRMLCCIGSEMKM